jgi:hypothetical protein
MYTGVPTQTQTLPKERKTSLEKNNHHENYGKEERV